MDLVSFLRSTTLLGQVATEIISLLADRMKPVTVPAHEVLIREGEAGDSLYLLQTGKLDVLLNSESENSIVISSLLPGESVGEIGLLTGAVRSATVRAAEPSLLWELTRQAFDQVSQTDSALRATVEAAMVERVQRAQLRSALYQNRLIKSLSLTVLPDFERALTLILLTSSETLFQAGEASDALYLVINGCLRIVPVKAPDDSTLEAPVKDIGSGQIVGEIGVTSGVPRTATAFALRDSLLARLAADDLYRLLQKYPQEMLQFTSARIASDYQPRNARTERRSSPIHTIALFAIGKDVPLAALAHALTRTLGQFGKARYIDDELVNRVLGHSDIARAPLESVADQRLAIWFGEQEAQHDYLVYSGREDLTQFSGGAEAMRTSAPNHPWSERCAQQADHILYVAWADSAPTAVTVAPASLIRRSLVLLHPPERRIPSGTASWLTAVKPDYYHHVCWRADTTIDEGAANDDIQRLARLLTGRGIGVVLSGGGARGYAHVGAIRALAEARIPIDLVGGTSMGAIVAGLSAIGHSADSMQAILIDHLSDRSQLVDYTLPLTSLLRGQKLERVMRTLFGDSDIVDTWRRFFCVSTDITYAAEVVHRDGPLWRSVRASMSLPGVFPPQVDADSLLVDGCLMNNYPANIMRNVFGCGVVIGVNACGEGDLHGKNQYGNSLSGWEILSSKFNPLAKPVRAPGLLETLIRLTDLNTVDRSQQQRRLTDLYIRPSIETYTAFDFEKHMEIIDVGYGAAQSALREWLAKEQLDAIF